MKSALFWDITRRRVLFTDGSGRRIGPVFKDQESKPPDGSLTPLPSPPHPVAFPLVQNSLSISMLNF
jgi:hypothetical protein